MHTVTRLSVAIGTGFTLALGVVAPVAAAPSTAPAASRPAARPALALDAPAAKTGVERSPVTAAVQRAVEPTECAPTQIDAYVDTLLVGLDEQELTFLLTSGVLDFPTYDALLFGSSDDPAYALPKEYRQDLTVPFRKAQRFWDVQSSDIDLLAMHGDTVLQDRARLTRLLTTLYGLAPAAAAQYADTVVRTVASIPELRGGDNPIFTLNAYAFTAEGETDPLIASIPDKIVFGDGILDFLEYAGLADVGPRVVLAHEFAHHVQFEQGLFDSPLTGAEATRRTELMADAMATYFATHKRGLALNAKRVLQAQRAFYEVGDCAFTNPGHHGTPLQRDRAAQWGADLASSARPQSRILPSLVVAERFDAALAEIVAG